jgi:hypothetical protein
MKVLCAFDQLRKMLQYLAACEFSPLRRREENCNPNRRRFLRGIVGGFGTEVKIQ